MALHAKINCEMSVRLSQLFDHGLTQHWQLKARALECVSVSVFPERLLVKFNHEGFPLHGLSLTRQRRVFSKRSST